MSFWGEWLWFVNLGYDSRFWTLVLAYIGSVSLGAALAGTLGFCLRWMAGVHLRRVVTLISALAGIVWGLNYCGLLLLYLNGATTGSIEPMLGQDTGFYLFTWPLLDSLFWLAFIVALLALSAALFVWEFCGLIRLRNFDEAQGHPLVLPLANAGFAGVLALGMWLAVYHLLYSSWAVVQGPGWIDVHVLRPALLSAAIGYVLVGLLPLIPAFRLMISRHIGAYIATRRPSPCGGVHGGGLVSYCAGQWVGISRGAGGAMAGGQAE